MRRARCRVVCAACSTVYRPTSWPLKCLLFICNWTALPRFSVLVLVFTVLFLNGNLASEARQAVGRILVGKQGGRLGYVVKLGVLRACPHILADPLLIHQAVPSRSSRTRCGMRSASAVSRTLVEKLGVLQACPHIRADPLLIHQAATTGCLQSGLLGFEGHESNPFRRPFKKHFLTKQPSLNLTSRPSNSVITLSIQIGDGFFGDMR